MKKFLGIKYLAFFFITFAVGFSANVIIKDSSPRYDSFTREEALPHLNKIVKSLCNAKSVSVDETSGRTMFIQKDEFRGGYEVVIDWDYSLRGKHEIIMHGKAEYGKCVREVGEVEK